MKMYLVRRFTLHWKATPVISLALLLAVATAPALSESTELCAAYPRTIEPDMQIQESDLTTLRAATAARELKEMMPSVMDDAAVIVDTVTELGIYNRLQVVVGYTLRQTAIEDASGPSARNAKAKASRKTFCTWLVERGVWYD